MGVEKISLVWVEDAEKEECTHLTKSVLTPTAAARRLPPPPKLISPSRNFIEHAGLAFR
jgi:hypothetical protein